MNLEDEDSENSNSDSEDESVGDEEEDFADLLEREQVQWRQSSLLQEP